MPLVGQALLDCVKDNVDADKNTLLEASGYFTENNGKKSYQSQAFYTALLEAQGIELKGFKKPSSGGVGRALPYKTVVQKNGSIVLGKGYLVKEGFETGDVFRVKCKEGALRLDPVREKN